MLVNIFFDKVTHSVARLYYKCILKRILYVLPSDTFPNKIHNFSCCLFCVSLYSAWLILFNLYADCGRD